MSAHTFSVGDHPRVEIRVQAGRVDCQTGPDGTISVEVGGRGGDAVVVDQQGDTVVVREERSGWMGTGSVRITATVPAETDVQMTGASTDLYIDGAVGELVVKTASGDISFDVVSRLDVKTASGDVRGSHVQGSAAISSASGDAHLDRVDGDLTARLATGDVHAQVVSGDVGIQSASGDVRIERCLGDEIDLRSVSGDLQLGLPGGIRLDANFNSLSGGIRLPEDRSEAGGDDRRRVRMSARTVSGDIRIERVPN